MIYLSVAGSYLLDSLTGFWGFKSQLKLTMCRHRLGLKLEYKSKNNKV